MTNCNIDSVRVVTLLFTFRPNLFDPSNFDDQRRRFLLPLQAKVYAPYQRALMQRISPCGLMDSVGTICLTDRRSEFTNGNDLWAILFFIDCLCIPSRRSATS